MHSRLKLSIVIVYRFPVQQYPDGIHQIRRSYAYGGDNLGISALEPEELLFIQVKIKIHDYVVNFLGLVDGFGLFLCLSILYWFSASEQTSDWQFHNISPGQLEYTGTLNSCLA